MMVKILAALFATIMRIVMVLPASALAQTTEDDGWTEDDYDGSPEEQEEQAQQDWEDAGRPGEQVCVSKDFCEEKPDASGCKFRNHDNGNDNLCNRNPLLKECYDNNTKDNDNDITKVVHKTIVIQRASAQI